MNIFFDKFSIFYICILFSASYRVQCHHISFTHQHQTYSDSELDNFNQSKFSFAEILMMMMIWTVSITLHAT